MKRKKRNPIPAAKAAVLALAEIAAATRAFERGETNVFDAWDAILAAVEAHCTNERRRPKAA